MFDENLLKQSKALGEILREKNKNLATAESCTGGNIAGIITAIPGSSGYFSGGIIAYSNEVKVKLLHVKEETLKNYGAVSEQTVVEMVKGVAEALNTGCAVATSGIAGPDGGTLEKPVGTIWIAAKYENKILTYRQKGDEGRLLNIKNAVKKAMEMMIQLIKER